MKTKTFDVFVTSDGLNYLNNNISAMVYPNNGTHKAKLIVEIPERTGTITESQFDSLLDNRHTNNVIKILSLRKELFGKEDTDERA